MKYMLGVPVWNKVDMLSWLLDGIRRHCDHKRCEVVFYFDACTDSCQHAYDLMRDFFLVNHGFKNFSFSGNEEVGEVGGHCRLIERFMATNCDVLIVPQDDQRLEANLLPCVDALFEKHGDGVGVIGGRDGFFRGYKNMCSSEWSESADCVTRLKHGEYVARPYVNSGPVIYNRRLIEKIGMPDREFKAFYVWDDYAERASRAGFSNFVMGMDVTHGKFGRLSASKFYEPEVQKHDRDLLFKKWGL